MSFQKLDFSIAVAAKRQHQNLIYLAPELSALLEGITIAAHSRKRHPVVQMLNGLADGGDLIAAATFIKWKKHKGNSDRLTAVLPFPTTEYLLTIDNKNDFHSILATAEQVVILKGNYREGRDSLAVAARAAAYRRQAEYMLEKCNLLLAVADEQDSVKAGGTVETVGIALKKQIPVLFFSLRTKSFCLLKHLEEFDALKSKTSITHGLTPEIICQDIVTLLAAVS